MTNSQFLLCFLTIIPLAGIAVMAIVRDYPAVLARVGLIITAIFLINIIALFYSYSGDNSAAFNLMAIQKDLPIGLSTSHISLVFLVLIGIIWLALTVYGNRYFLISNDQFLFWFKIFMALLIELIVLILFAKNLISMFLFYQALIFVIYFCHTYFVHKDDIKASYNFTFLLLLSSLAFLLAVILTYKISGSTEFAVVKGLSSSSYAVLICLYLAGIVIMALLPLYLLYGSLYYLSAPVIMLTFVVAYALVILFMLLKVLIGIFGTELLIYYDNQSSLNLIIKIILAFNLLISAFFSLVGKNLKKILIYLFFNQLILVIFAFFVFKAAAYQMIITVISFILSQILLFLSIGNINLYLFNSEQKSVKGLFRQLRITVGCLIFALLNMVGLAPAIGFAAKYYLFQQAIADKSFLEIFIVIVNIVLNIICAIKIIYPMLNRQKVIDRSGLEAARKIEFDSGLLFAISFMVFIMCFSLFFSFSKAKLITDFI